MRRRKPIPINYRTQARTLGTAKRLREKGIIKDEDLTDICESLRILCIKKMEEYKTLTIPARNAKIKRDLLHKAKLEFEAKKAEYLKVAVHILKRKERPKRIKHEVLLAHGYRSYLTDHSTDWTDNPVRKDHYHYVVYCYLYNPNSKFYDHQFRKDAQAKWGISDNEQRAIAKQRKKA